MTTHGRKLKDGRIRQLFHPPGKAQRVLHAVPGNSRLAAATLRILDRSADIHRDSQIRASHVVYERFHVLIVVKHRRDRGVPVDAGDHFFRIGALIALPVGFRIQILSRPEHAAFGGVAHVHGIVLQCQPQECSISRYQIVVVDPAARHGKNDEVVLNRLRIGRPFKSIVFAVAV